MSKLTEDLLAVRELVSEGWLQGTFACDVNGSPTYRDWYGNVMDLEPTDPRSCKFCLTGAVYRVANCSVTAPHVNEATPMVEALWRALPTTERIEDPGLVRPETMEPELVNWNDNPGRSVTEVVSLVDAAIRAHT